MPVTRSFQRSVYGIATIVLVLQLNVTLGDNLRELTVTDWWEKAGFYHVYPRSLKDSNGDGIGDLNGITEKLPYLKSIGIKAFWLSPIYKSPMADFGYDISSYVEIQPEYGTMSDFENLVKNAKELDLKVILDFVPNHSSDEHEWFVKSVNKEAGYEDFYIWHDGVEGTPPNNWNEAFRGSAWQWNPTRGQFYLHQFHRKQPDLNYRNPAVVAAMKNVLRFWLDKGVSGFRVDAIANLFEDEQFRDEPPSGDSQDDPLRPQYLSHIYTQDLPETVDMVYQWREVLDAYQKEHGGETRVLITEAPYNLTVVATYFNDSNGREGSQIPFNFQLIKRLDQNSNASDYKAVIDSWLDIVPIAHTPNYVLGNHDVRRVASRMGGSHMVDLMQMIELSMPGISVTYQGDEIGMTDFEISWEDTKDPAACQTNENEYKKWTRDPARTPFQWDDSANAGFTTASKSWLPVNTNYKTVNVFAEQKAARSNLKVFEALMKLRDEEDFYDSRYGTAVLGNVFAILRSTPSKTYITLVNLADSYDTVNVVELFSNFSTKEYDTSVVRICSVASKQIAGDTIMLRSVTLDAYEGLVLQSGTWTRTVNTILLLFALLIVLLRKCY